MARLQHPGTGLTTLGNMAEPGLGIPERAVLIPPTAQLDTATGAGR